MIKNIYFQCQTCGDIVAKFMDDQYASGLLQTLGCVHCGGKTFKETEYKKSNKPGQIKTKLKDNRGTDREKYMSKDYKDIRSEINRVHKDKKGLYGKNKDYL